MVTDFMGRPELCSLTSVIQRSVELATQNPLAQYKLFKLM